MNGDLGKIYNKLIQLETKQEERHTANLTRMDKLDNLPCAIHTERMRWFNRYLIGIFTDLTAITGWIITHVGK